MSNAVKITFGTMGLMLTIALLLAFTDLLSVPWAIIAGVVTIFLGSAAVIASDVRQDPSPTYGPLDTLDGLRTAWEPETLSDVTPAPFRDPWADDPDRTVRRETYP